MNAQLAIGGNQWLDETQAALRKLVQDGGSGENIGLVLAPTITLLKHLQTPCVDARKRARIVAFSAPQSIPFPLEEVEWDSILASESATAQHVLLAAVKRKVTDALCAAVASSGREVAMVLPSASAMVAAARNARLSEGESSLVLQVGTRSATLLQLAGKNFAVRSIRLGGDCLDRAMALDKLLLPEVVRAGLTFHQEIGLPEPGRLWLVSDAGIPEKFSQELAARLKLPVNEPRLADHVLLGAGLPQAAGLVGGGLAEMAGAASLMLDPTQPVLNLLPSRLRARQRNRHRKPWLVAAGFLALAAPMVPVWQYHVLAEIAQDKGVRLEEELVGLRARAAAIQREQNRWEDLNRSISAWEKVEAGRKGWVHFLADLQERLIETEDVWLEQLKPLPQSGNAPFKIELVGELLDRDNPLEPTGPAVLIRGKELLKKMAASPFVSAIEQERFDGSKPGRLAFQLVLVIGSQASL